MKLKMLIRELRNRSKMDSVQFGRAAGLGRKSEDKIVGQQVSKFENGHDRPSLLVLERMMALAGLTLDDCLSTPEHREKDKQIHATLDRLLNDERWRPDVEKWFEFIEFKAKDSADNEARTPAARSNKKQRAGRR